jgi:hypothetical protein
LFERYTERARRAIFFARYEASALGTMQITAEELLLGILREDKFIAARVGLDALLAIRKELEQIAPPKGERVPTSVDMPLSHETRRALEYATEEADALQRKMIDTPHLVLGLLRIDGCLAATLLRKHGLEYDSYRTSLQGPVEALVAEKPPATPAAPLDRAAQALQQLVNNLAARSRSDSYGDQRLKRKPWTRKEALGHLIDWAMTHHNWLTLALIQSRLEAPGYPPEVLAAIRRYQGHAWTDTVDLWVLLNQLLVHVLLRVPEEKADMPCRIGIVEPVPLAKLMDAYVEHCQDIVGQILARLE